MNIDETVLTNNLRVITHTMPGLHTATVGTYVNAGSRYETEANNGIAHFLEHMAFKGTTKRTAFDISHEVEVLGSRLNAMTSTWVTAYYANGLAKNAPTAVDIIGDALTDSKFDTADIDLESGVIVQEINQYKDDPYSTMSELMTLTAYPDQPVGRKILGTIEFVTNAQPNDFRSFINEHYSAETMILFAAGGIEHAAIVDAAAKAFSKVPSTTNRGPVVPATYVGGLGIDRGTNFSQVSAGIMFPSVPVIDVSVYAHQLLAEALGGAMSSPLFTEVREKRGLVYFTSAYSDHDVDHGNFSIVGGMTADNLAEFINVACSEFAKMQENINEVDLIRAKNSRLVSLAMMQESPSSMTGYMATSMFTRGRIRDFDEIRRNIEAVTLNDLKLAAKRILQRTPTISLVGPVPDLDYEGIVKTAIGGV